MIKFSGKSVCGGIAMGKIRVLKKENSKVKRRKIDSADTELACLRIAIERTKVQLKELYEKALVEVGEASAAIFEVHQMMLEDEDYLGAIENMIKTEEVNAEFAVAVTGDNFALIFANMDDDYMKARASDVKDVSERLLKNLDGKKIKDVEKEEQVIIIAEDLTPSETVQMDKDKIKAFVTVKGSANSHTAILARMMNIPALIGVHLDINELQDGNIGIVDGINGELIINPTDDLVGKATKKMQAEENKDKLLEELKGKENITLDGKKVNVYANIGSVEDIGYVLENHLVPNIKIHF